MLQVENDFSFDQFHENESYRLLYKQEMINSKQQYNNA